MCWNQWNSCEFKRVLNVSLLRKGNSYIDQEKHGGNFTFDCAGAIRPFDPVAQIVEGFTCLVMTPTTETPCIPTARTLCAGLKTERSCVASTNVRKFYKYSSPNHPTLRTGDSTGFLQVPGII